MMKKHPQKSEKVYCINCEYVCYSFILCHKVPETCDIVCINREFIKKEFNWFDENYTNGFVLPNKYNKKNDCTHFIKKEVKENE